MGCIGHLKMIKLKCPRCGVVWYRESLEAVLKEIEEMWKPWEDSMTEQQKQKVRDYNSIERLQKFLDKEGHLTVLCSTCRLIVTIQAMRNLKMSFTIQRVKKHDGIGG